MATGGSVCLNFFEKLARERLPAAYFVTDIHMYDVERHNQGLPRERVSTPLSACGWFCRQQRVYSGEARNRLVCSSLRLPGGTLALCVFCMPLISPKVRSERRGLGASSGCCVPRHTRKQNSFRFCYTKKCPKAREKRVLIGVTVWVKKRVLIGVTVWVSVVRSQDLRRKIFVTRSPSQDLRRKIGISVFFCRG